MCGFGGVINNKEYTNISDLAKVAQAVSYRGPNYTGLNLYNEKFSPCSTNGKTALFHNRLSILDLSEQSNQPFENERFILLFNGEIYNYQELASELLNNPLNIKFNSDTTVLFNLLVEYGVSCIEKLNGMFALVFIDKLLNKIYFARDRVGIKPIYFFNDGKTLIFGSETDSIIRLGKLTPSVSLQATNLYLRTQYIPGDLTIWDGIKKILPGHIYSCDLNASNLKITKERFWSPFNRLDEKRDPLDIVNSAICRQSKCDVPLGLSISSGVDSSLIGCSLLRHIHSKSIKFFTAKLEKDNNCEYEDASRFLKDMGINSSDHIPVEINMKNLANSFTNLYQKVDQPFGDYTILLNMESAKKVKEEIKVLLCGDGADELFNGYKRYSEWKKLEKFYKYIGRFFPRRFISGKNKYIWLRCVNDRVSVYLAFVLNGVDNYHEISTIKNQLIPSDYLKEIEGSPSLPQLIDLVTYLPDCMLYKVDRASMSEGIEARVPLIDNEVINYALYDNLGSIYIEQKKILKKILNYLSCNVYKIKRKKGFSLDLRNFVKTYLSDFILYIKSQPVDEKFEYIKKEFIDMANKLEEKNFNIYKFWIYMNFLNWYHSKKII